MPYRKEKIEVKIPHLSGYDMSHRNTGTGYCGELVPLLTEEVVPGPQHLRLPINVKLPPLVSDTYMNCKYKIEAFFVPHRLLCSSFESFFSDFPASVISRYYSSGGSLILDDIKGVLPKFKVDEIPNTIINASAGSLLDYMGFKSSTYVTGAANFCLSPLLAYHLVWQEWYRNPRVQKPAFVKPLIGVTGGNQDSNRGRLVTAPYTYFHESYTNSQGTVIPGNDVFAFSNASEDILADGHSLFETRQRNFGLDYFTGARVSPQQGEPSAVSFDVTVPEGAETGSGSFTISQLRAANSLQQFRERNNLPSPRLVDQVKVRYNVDLSDGVAQRPICIGSASYNVTTSGIDQTGATADETTDNANPFNAIAAQYGRGQANGADFIIDNFFAKEPGYIIALGSLVPEVTYTSGINPMFRRYTKPGSITDMACSLLQNVGDQPILSSELTGVGTDSDTHIFGYTDRYADWMFHPNEVHGRMREFYYNPGSGVPVLGDLRSFVLQRGFDTSDNNLELSSSFLEIPKNYMDGVMQFNSSTYGLTYWYDCIVDYKRSMPLAEYSIPSLQDPAYEHGQTVNIRRNGQIF